MGMKARMQACSFSDAAVLRPCCQQLEFGSAQHSETVMLALTVSQPPLLRQVSDCVAVGRADLRLPAVRPKRCSSLRIHILCLRPDFACKLCVCIAP